MQLFKSGFGSLIAVLALGVFPLAAAPVVTVGSPSVVFSYTTAGAVPPAQIIPITSDVAAVVNGVSINYISGGNPSWLSVFGPFPQNTPANLTLAVNPTTLASGSYIAQINVNAGTVDPASTLTITVFLTVAGGPGGPPAQTIAASPASLSFVWNASGPPPPAQTLSVTVNDGSSFSVSRTNDAIAQWLSVSPQTSNSPGTISVTADPTGLPAGTYSGVVTLSSSFSVVQVPVSLVIAGLGLSSNPAVVSLSVPQNYGLSAPQFVQISAAGGGALPFQTYTVSDLNWLQVDIPTGTTPAVVQVRANTSGLAQGSYLGTLTVRSGSIASTDIGVALTVGPPASIGLQPASLSFAYTIGDPAPATQTSRVASLSANPQAFTFTTRTADGANWLLASGSQATTPAVITVQVSPANLAPGTYQGAVNLTPGVTNASPQPIQVTLTVKAPPPPTVQSITNSASYGTVSVAPGEFVTLFGSNIGPKTLAVSPAGVLPRTLGGTTVSFDTIPAPILYASSAQTSVQVPYGVTPGQPTSVVVNYNNLNSTPKVVPVTASYPGLFTSDSSGKGQAAALNADFSLNNAANPVARGGVLVLYGTGEGQVTPSVADGSIIPVVAPIPKTQLPVLVTIGGQLAEVLYFGETPGVIAGLMQLNVRVPAAAPTGGAVPVLIFVNGVPSQANVTVAIQ